MEPYRDGNSIQASEIDKIRGLISNRTIKKLLEIGTYRGNIVFSLYDLVVEENEGSLTSVDIRQSNDYHKQNKLYAKEHELGNIYFSFEGSDRFFVKNNKKFDMIILDGDQSYDQLKRDMANSCDVLMDGGVILMHDYRDLSSVQMVANEVDGNRYKKELIHTVHHLMMISKKKFVENSPKNQSSKSSDEIIEDDISSKEVYDNKIKEEKKKDGANLEW